MGWHSYGPVARFRILRVSKCLRVLKGTGRYGRSRIPAAIGEWVLRRWTLFDPDVFRRSNEMLNRRFPF